MARCPARTILAAALLTFQAAPSTALIIDNFEEGPFTVIDQNLNDLLGNTFAAVGEQSGLSSANVVGGVRLVMTTALEATLIPDLADIPDPLALLPIPAPAIPVTATALLASPLPVVDDGAQFNALGGGFFRLIYDGIAGGNTRRLPGAPAAVRELPAAPAGAWPIAAG